MADWTNLPNQAVGVGGLPSGTTVTALRDNPVAIAQGAAGAPRIQTAAIQNSAVTAAKLATSNSERDWVLARIAGAQAGAVGTYAFLGRNVGFAANNEFGATLAGSNLFPAGIRATSTFSNSVPGVASQHSGQNSARSGTWRCMGVVRGETGIAGASLWLRIS